MNFCLLPELCKCDASQVCLFCKILVLVFVALISAVIGYLIGKRRKDKTRTQLKINKRQIKAVTITAIVTIFFCSGFYFVFLRYSHCKYCGAQIKWQAAYCSRDCQARAKSH